MNNRIFYIVLFFLFPQVSYSQISNSYTVGANSMGDYGMRLDRGNENSNFSFSFSSINSIAPSTSSFSLAKPGSLNMGIMGIAYEKRKLLTQKLELFYGSEVNLISGMRNNSNVASAANGNYLPNLSLNVGMKYKFTENISLSATIIQGYGYGLGYTMSNNLFNFGNPGIFNNSSFNNNSWW